MLELGASTDTVTVAVWLRPEAVPVTVTAEVPAAAVAVALSVMRKAFVATALNDAVKPFGKPEAVTVTFAVKPFSAVSVIRLVPDVP